LRYLTSRACRCTTFIRDNPSSG